MAVTNRDVTRRAALLGIEDRDVDLMRFEELTPSGLLTLVNEGFADYEDRQNDAPSIEEFLDFVVMYPDIPITFHGYAISPSRNDYRVSIEGFHAQASDYAQIGALTAFGSHADDYNIGDDGSVFAWWD